MRASLIFWAILFVLGVLVGERYGLPGGITGLTDRGFEAVEGWLGRTGEPGAEDANDAGAVEETGDGAVEETGGDAASNAGLRINEAGLQIIKDSESLRLEAYQAGGAWYIGYGHKGASAGQKITEAQADQLLREDVRTSEDVVKGTVAVPVNVNQFSAMVSFAYNLGAGNFKKSTVVERINKGDYAGAADGFLNHNTAGGKVVDHLTERRQKERALFLTPA